MEKPKAGPFPPQELTAAEVAALYEALLQRGETQARDTALLRVLEHGLRASEVAALDVGDYDGRQLHIRPQNLGRELKQFSQALKLKEKLKSLSIVQLMPWPR